MTQRTSTLQTRKKGMPNSACIIFFSITQPAKIAISRPPMGINSDDATKSTKPMYSRL